MTARPYTVTSTETRYATFEEAEAAAIRLYARDGRAQSIHRLGVQMARVCSDAAGRVWTDLTPDAAPLPLLPRAVRHVRPRLPAMVFTGSAAA